MNLNKVSKKKLPELFARALQARRHLYFSGFITESENDRIHERMKKLQNKHEVCGVAIHRCMNDLIPNRIVQQIIEIKSEL